MLQVQKLLPKNAQGSSRLAVIMRQIEMLLQLGQNPPIEWMQMLKEVQCELNWTRFAADLYANCREYNLEKDESRTNKANNMANKQLS